MTKAKGKPKRAKKAAKAKPSRSPPALARMTAVAAGGGEVEVKRKAPPPDADGAAAKPAPAAVVPPPPADGVEVMARGASKFSLADIEALKAAIKIKGAGTVVEGINFDELKWDAEGLLPVVAQDRRSGAVLMLGWTNRETLESSLKTKSMTYYDRARGKPVAKGEATGRPQRLVAMSVDCDKDALLATVEQEGPACHRDTGTCWADGRSQPVASFVGELDRIVAAYAKAPKTGSHTSELLAEPVEALKRMVEKANDAVRTIQGKSTKEPLEHEAADLVYHLLVACRTKGVGLERILNDLYAQHLATQVKKA